MKVAVLIIFFICTLLAWILGRYQAKNISPKKQFPRDYLMGLNFLLNEETDKAVDFFIKMLAVDSETVETHLAVGKLFRKRGEVERAIRIHQNLIARPQLMRKDHEEALFELGQDYLSAGMLDRAERIFLDLIHAKNYAELALQTLLEIYQQEKAWQRALDIANKYESITTASLKQVKAHYYCELAESLLLKQEMNEAKKLLHQAIMMDKTCVRASLLQAKIAYKNAAYQSALQYLKQIKDQDPNYLAESINLLAECYEKLNLNDELLDYLKELVEAYPRISVVLILAERLRVYHGTEVATQFVSQYIKRFPSLNGLGLYINLYLATLEGRIKEDLIWLQNLIKQLLEKTPNYQCVSCGFAGKTLHWYCPGCKKWSTVLPIDTLEVVD